MFNVIDNLATQFYPASAPDSIRDFLIVGLNILAGVGFGAAIVNLAWACYLYIMSKGDPKGVQQAWNAVVYGAFAILISFVVIGARLTITQALGVTDPNITNLNTEF